MSEAAVDQGLLVTAPVARQALHTLLNQKIHNTFAGYLCVKLTARQAGKTDKLQPKFQSFFEQFLRADKAPAGTPFVLPFWERKGRGWSPFFNVNVAGSYAPSSLRGVSPFRRVVDIEGGGRQATYSLMNEHASRAHHHLLNKQPVPILSLALFLYRDFGLRIPASADALVDLFREDFAYRAGVPEEDKEFALLFRDDRADYAAGPLFSPN